MKKRTLLLAVPLWMLLFVPILPMWAQDSKAQRVLRPGVGDPAGTPAKRGPIVGAKPWHREGGKLRKTPRSLVMPNPNQRVRLASADGVEFWGNVIYAKSWDTLPNDATPFYVGQFRGTNPITIQNLCSGAALDANGGGVFKDGMFRFVSYFSFLGEIMGQYYTPVRDKK